MNYSQALYPEVSTERFAENVKTRMKEQGISAAQLQRMIPVGTVQTVYKWLYGKSIPEYATLCALARIFDVHVEELLEPRFHSEIELPGPRTADRAEHFYRPFSPLALPA